MTKAPVSVPYLTPSVSGIGCIQLRGNLVTLKQIQAYGQSATGGERTCSPWVATAKWRDFSHFSSAYPTHTRSFAC